MMFPPGRLEVESVVLKKFTLKLKSPLPLCRWSSRVDITDRNGVYVVIHSQFYPADGSSSPTPCCGVGEACPLPLFHPDRCFEPVMEPIPIPRSIDLTADAVYEASRIASSGDISLQGAVEMALLGCVCECIGKRPAEVLSWYGGANGREISQVVKINQMYTREENQGGAQLRGCVKLKVGENPIRDAEKVNSAASGLVGTARLRLDANQSWTPDEYHTFATSLSESTKAKIEYIEEPTVTWNDDLIRLGIPTAMDESLATAKSFPACERTDVYFVLKPGVIGWRRACQYVASYPHRCCLSSMFESSLAMYWCTALASLCGDGVYHGLSTSGRVIEPRKRTYEDITRKSEGQWFVNVHDCEEELKTITAALVRENDDFSIF